MAAEVVLHPGRRERESADGSEDEDKEDGSGSGSGSEDDDDDVSQRSAWTPREDSELCSMVGVSGVAHHQVAQPLAEARMRDALPPRRARAQGSFRGVR